MDRLQILQMRLSLLLQSTLDVRDSVYQTVRKELCTVENYLYLQKYRYARQVHL
ncbi:MAG: hypothetical protein V8Q57_01705 [Blautia sp.]